MSQTSGGSGGIQDSTAGRLAFAKPWEFLKPVPLGAAYIVFVVAALAVAYVCAVLVLYEPPIFAEELSWDPVVICVAALVPAVALWISFWRVGTAVKRGSPRTYGYFSVGMTFLATCIVWSTVLVRDTGKGHGLLLLPVILILWVIQVCMAINTYNCLCGLAHIASQGKRDSLRAFFSERRESPELPLVHVYLHPSVYALSVSAVGTLILIPELLWLNGGWVRYAEEFQIVLATVVLRDFALAAVTAASLVWYQSGLAHLRRIAGASKTAQPTRREGRGLQVQHLPEESGTLRDDRSVIAKSAAAGEGELEKGRDEIGKLEGVERQDDFGEIIGGSPAVVKFTKQIERVKDTDTAVLITGETGVGKDLIARAIHDHGARHNAPFVTANLAGFPDTALESELFGHERGAFTGAVDRKKGKFELADRGTIFLDEVGDLNETCQMRLLRVLEHGEFERMGGTRTLRVDVRVIAATNRDLRRALKDGIFRQDLYYRLKEFHIEIPPLRERKEDIPALVDHFCKKLGKPKTRFTSAAMDRLLTHEWPGNIRDLRNCIKRALHSAKDNVVGVAEIDIEDLEIQPELLYREDSEEQLMIRALKESRSSKDARRKLKMRKSTFYDKLKRYGIRPKDFLRGGE